MKIKEPQIVRIKTMFELLSDKNIRPSLDGLSKYASKEDDFQIVMAEQMLDYSGKITEIVEIGHYNAYKINNNSYTINKLKIDDITWCWADWMISHEIDSLDLDTFKANAIPEFVKFLKKNKILLKFVSDLDAMSKISKEIGRYSQLEFLYRYFNISGLNHTLAIEAMMYYSEDNKHKSLIEFWKQKNKEWIAHIEAGLSISI